MKRKTKKQREAEGKAALRKRVEDMAVAAEGDSGPAGDDWWASAVCLSRWIPALRSQFGLDEKGEEIERLDYLWFPTNLHHYENVDTATEFLWDHGVRA